MELELARADGGNVRYCFINIDMSRRETAGERLALLKTLVPAEGTACAALYVPDAENALSPWEAPAVFGNEPFGNGAEVTLQYMVETLLPWLRNELPGGKDTRFIIEGYSFAGLFALWSAYNTDAFSAACGVSPSVWYPRWIDYAQSHELRTDFMYLSIGKAEKKTRNMMMRPVEECLIRMSEIARAKLGEGGCTLEYNEGNHFTDVPLRRARAMAECLKRFEHCSL